MSKSKEVTLSHIKAYTPLALFTECLEFEKKRTNWTPSYPVVNQTTPIGIEVEVEQILTNDRVGALKNPVGKELMAYVWSNIEDGSLRNHGREFVSIPLVGDNIEFGLSKLHVFLNNNKDCVGHEFTDRTSVHIHMNARDLTMKQFESFLLIYLAMEPVLYNFCGGRRHKNIFCVPLNQTSLDKDINNIFSVCKKAPAHLHDYLRRWKKYCGLNLKPITGFGTIEFRHMVGTIDVERLMIWINLILSIKNYAIENSLEDVHKTVVNLNSTSEYLLLLRQVFGEFSDRLMFSNLQRRMEETVIFIKDCISDNRVEGIKKIIKNKDVPVTRDSSKFIQKLIKRRVLEPLVDGVIIRNKQRANKTVRVAPLGAGRAFFDEAAVGAVGAIRDEMIAREFVARDIPLVEFDDELLADELLAEVDIIEEEDF